MIDSSLTPLIRRAGMGVAALLVLIVVALLIAGGCGSSSDDEASAPAVDTTAAPADVACTTWQGVTLPASSVDGPRTVDGAVAKGYSHTPQGAALAAAQTTTRLQLAPDTDWVAVANTLAAPGLGRDTYAVNRALVSITQPASGPNVQSLKGFRFDTYTPQRAVVKIAVNRHDPAAGREVTTVATQTMVWSGSDWLLLLPEAGKEHPATTIPDLAGYTPFGCP